MSTAPTPSSDYLQFLNVVSICIIIVPKDNCTYTYILQTIILVFTIIIITFIDDYDGKDKSIIILNITIDKGFTRV